MTRTPEEVFRHHVQALGAGDLDEIVADYADDAVLITPGGVQRGKDGNAKAYQVRQVLDAIARLEAEKNEESDDDA